MMLNFIKITVNFWNSEWTGQEILVCSDGNPRETLDFSSVELCKSKSFWALLDRFQKVTSELVICLERNSLEFLKQLNHFIATSYAGKSNWLKQVWAAGSLKIDLFIIICSMSIVSMFEEDTCLLICHHGGSGTSEHRSFLLRHRIPTFKLKWMANKVLTQKLPAGELCSSPSRTVGTWLDLFDQNSSKLSRT